VVRLGLMGRMDAERGGGGGGGFIDCL